MSTGSPIPTETLPEVLIPASRIMRERDEARAEVERLGDQLRIEIRRRQKADRHADANEAAWETLCELLKSDAIGKDCETCDGTGIDDDVEPVHVGGPTNAYRERHIEVECGECFAGRVAK